MSYEKALSALADPTRRGLLDELRKRPRTVGELARSAHVSQPAVTQHLKVLAEARLVEDRWEGTRHFYQAAPAGLAALRTYLDAVWDEVLKSYQGDDPTPPEEVS